MTEIKELTNVRETTVSGKSQMFPGHAAAGLKAAAKLMDASWTYHGVGKYEVRPDMIAKAVEVAEMVISQMKNYQP